MRRMSALFTVGLVATVLLSGCRDSDAAKPGTAVPVENYHALFVQAVAAKYRPTFLNGYDVAGKACLNVVFRPDNGPAWYEYTEMSSTGYRNAGQCSGLQAGGEGPRWEGRQARTVP